MVLHASSSSTETCVTPSTYLEAFIRSSVTHKSTAGRLSPSSVYPTLTTASSRRALRQLVRELSQEELAEWDDCALTSSQAFSKHKYASSTLQQDDKEKDAELDREWQVIDVKSHETHSHSILISPTNANPTTFSADTDTDCHLINTNLTRTWDHHEEPIDECDLEVEDMDEDEGNFSIDYDYDGTPLYISTSVENDLALADYKVSSRRLYYQEAYRRCLMSRRWNVPKVLRHRISHTHVDHTALRFFQSHKRKITRVLETRTGRAISKKSSKLSEYPFLNPFEDQAQERNDKHSLKKSKRGSEEKKAERRRIARLYKRSATAPYGRSSDQRSAQQLARYVRAQQLKNKVKQARVQNQRKKMTARKIARELKRQSARNFQPLPPRKAGVARPLPWNPNAPPAAVVPRATSYLPNIQPGKKQVVEDSFILHSTGSFEQFRYQFYQRYKEKLQHSCVGFICTGIRNAPLGSHVKDRFMREMKARQVDPVLSFHGTRLGNMQSICDRGLLVPGDEGAADIKVLHGSALGKGIYTCQNLNYPVSYAGNSRTLFACAVIADLSKPHVTGFHRPSPGQVPANPAEQWPKHTEKDVVVSGNVIVLFKHALVVPLFLIDIWRPEWEGTPEEYRQYDERKRRLAAFDAHATGTTQADDEDVKLVDQFINAQTKTYSDETQSLPSLERHLLVKLLTKSFTKAKTAGVQLSQKAQTQGDLVDAVHSKDNIVQEQAFTD